MRNLTITHLKRRLSRATWLPLCIMSAFFLTSLACVLEKQYTQQLESIRFSLSDLISSQETQFAQEILLNQAVQAIPNRIKSIVKDWEKKHPKSQVCLAVTLNQGSSQGKILEECSQKAAVAGYFENLLSHQQEIRVGSGLLATINFSVTRSMVFSDFFPPAVLLSLCFAIIAALVSYSLLIRRVERTILTPLIAKLSEEERNTAIANTAQMVAHDIRKPFAVIRLVLEKLTHSKVKAAREIGQELSQDVSQCMEKIDAMLKDVLDINKKSAPTLESVSLQNLIDQSLGTVIRLYPDAKVTVTADLESTHKILADKGQLIRVLTNLIENAFQAMNGSGSVKIKAHEKKRKGRNLIEVTLTNSGPEITKEDQAIIFHPLVTRKKDGTGLGLAISKKIIEAHGGVIWCKSSKTSGTTFGFLLPVSAKVPVEPQKTFEIIEINQNKTTNATALSSLREKTILVFDDERIVHEAWDQFAKSYPYLTLAHFKSWEDFVNQDGFQISENAVAFIDIHYANSNYDGLFIAESLKKLGVRKLYAITSDQESATQSGLFHKVFGKEIPKEIAELVA